MNADQANQGFDLTKGDPIGQGGFGQVYQILRVPVFLKMNADQANQGFDLTKGDPIGQGGFGQVYLFKEDQLSFVVKSIGLLRKTEKQLNDFRKECETLKKLNHPNIVECYDIVEFVKDGQTHFHLKMEYCERKSLSEMINDPKVVYSMKNVVVWTEQLFSALHYCHEMSIVHRDLKPENILVTADFTLKIADFGLLKETSVTCTTTETGGTHRYISPPQVDPNRTNNREEPKASPRNDVYSLGLVLWELIERRVVLWEYGKNGCFDQWDFYFDVAFGRILRIIPPDCIEEFQEVVTHCIEFKRSIRPIAKWVLDKVLDFKKIKGITVVGEYPRIEEDQEELLRPIGFDEPNGQKRIPVSEDEPQKPSLEEMDSNSVDGSADEGSIDGSDDENSVVPASLTEPYLDLFQRSPRLRAKFDALSDADKLIYFEKIGDIILEANKRDMYSIREHKRGDLSPYNPIDDLKESFRAWLFGHQNRFLLWLSQHFFNNPFDLPKFLPWSSYAQISFLINQINAFQRMLLPSTLIFKCYRSSKTRDEWFFIDEVDKVNAFIRIDFNQQRYGGNWVDDLKKKICEFENDELHFTRNRPIEIVELSECLENVRESIQFQAETAMIKYVSLPSSQQVTDCFKSSSAIGKHLPIPEYIFQLKNPPRAPCRHHEECSIKKFHPIKSTAIPEELQIPYYACATPEQLNYLWTWSAFGFYLESLRFAFNPVDFMENYDSSSVSSTESLILVQCLDDSNQYLTLLDLPFTNPSSTRSSSKKVPCLDPNYKLIDKESKEIEFLLSKPLYTRRYLLVAQVKPKNWSKCLLDFEGNQIEPRRKNNSGKRAPLAPYKK